MAESQHTLHLVAKLDTTDVQAKLRQLNSSGGITAPSSAASSSSLGVGSLAAGGLVARQLQNSANQTSKALANALKPLSSASSQLTRQMSQAMSSMTTQMNRMQRQMLSQVNQMQIAQAQIARLAGPDGGGHLTKRILLNHPGSAEVAQMLTDIGFQMPKGAASFFSSKAGGKRLGGKNPLISMSVGPGGYGTYNYATSFAAPSFAPALMTAPGPGGSAASSAKDAANMQRRKMMIGRAGLAYAAVDLMPAAADLAGAYGHSKTEYLLKAFGRIGKHMAAGAMTGAAIGAAGSAGIGTGPGAVMGGLIAGIVSGTKELITAFGLMRRNAVDAANSLKQVTTAISTTLVALRESRHISSISGMTREQAAAALDRASKHVSLIQRDIDEGQFGNMAGLNSLLSEQSMHQDRMAAAQARLDELQAERQRRAAAAEAAAAAARVRQAQLEGLHTSASDAILGMDQAALSRGNALKLAGMAADGNVDTAWLRAGWKKHGAEASKWRESARYHLAMASEADTPELASSMMSEASRHQSRASFSLSQADFFKAGLLAALQDQLSRLAAPDMSHVTSLGQYGYGMGEKNDNIERQMQIWEEQAQLQRDIRDILSDKTFEAAYSE